ncbi:MAG: type IV pilus assembly protein PilM [Gemmatimonadota bacterium]|nr:type IV pilus assembly protein PilM [Gemmatimonadota bacterium]MDE2983818.1 type IV pilus assembly protein PilM [Gemmatimonadota bacterium]
MALFNRGRTVAGLDIGSGYVKLALVDHGGDRPEVRGAAIRPTPRGAVVDGEVVEPARVAGAIRELMDESGVRARNIVAALGGHDVFIKRLKLPRVKEKEAARAIRQEAERHVPFDLEEVRLDFQILPTRRSAAHIEVLLVAAKRECVESRVSLLADAGIRAAALDVGAFALHNAFVHNYPGSADGVVALVNVGRDVTNLNVIEEGVPVLAKDLPLGSRKVAESLQRDFRLTEEQSEQVLQGRQPLEGVQRVVADGVALGLRRAAAYLGGRRSGDGVGRIFLSGGGACMPGIVEALAERVQVETRLVNPFERVPVREEAWGRRILTGAAPMMFLPVGLALRAA